jgi:hypothetical protein
VLTNGFGAVFFGDLFEFVFERDDGLGRGDTKVAYATKFSRLEVGAWVDDEDGLAVDFVEQLVHGGVLDLDVRRLEPVTVARGGFLDWFEEFTVSNSGSLALSFAATAIFAVDARSVERLEAATAESTESRW